MRNLLSPQAIVRAPAIGRLSLHQASDGAASSLPSPVVAFPSGAIAHPRLGPLPARPPRLLRAHPVAGRHEAEGLHRVDTLAVLQASLDRFRRLPPEVRAAMLERSLESLLRTSTATSAERWAALAACAHVLDGARAADLRRRVFEAWVRRLSTPEQWRAFLARLSLLLPAREYGAYLRAFAGRLIRELPAPPADHQALLKLGGVLAEVRTLGPAEQRLSIVEIQDDLKAAGGRDGDDRVQRLIEAAVANLSSPTALHELLDLLEALVLEPAQRLAALRCIVEQLGRARVQQAICTAWPEAASDDGSMLHRTLYKLDRQLRQLPGVDAADSRRLALHLTFPLARLNGNMAGLHRYWQAWCPGERLRPTRAACAEALGRIFPATT